MCHDFFVFCNAVIRIASVFHVPPRFGKLWDGDFTKQTTACCQMVETVFREYVDSLKPGDVCVRQLTRGGRDKMTAISLDCFNGPRLASGASRDYGKVYHFADDSFKCVFFNVNERIISIKISLKFVPKCTAKIFHHWLK